MGSGETRGVMPTAQNNKSIDATSLGGTDGAASSSLPSDPALMQAVVQRAFGEFFMNARLGGPMNPSPELLHLLRGAPAVIACNDHRWRAKLSLLTGLIHEFTHDVDGADACYAAAAEADPNVLKRGVLANIHRMSIRQRGRNAAVIAPSTTATSTGSMAPAGRARLRRPAAAGSRGRSRAGGPADVTGVMNGATLDNKISGGRPLRSGSRAP